VFHYAGFVTITLSILLKIKIFVFFALRFYGGACMFYHFCRLLMVIYLAYTFLVVKTLVPPTVNSNDGYDDITYFVEQSPP
jgi:hypothetical protein